MDYVPNQEGQPTTQDQAVYTGIDRTGSDLEARENQKRWRKVSLLTGRM